MPDLFFERHVPHVPERMFDLVNDLESYPRFIPNCAAMKVTPDRGAAGNVRLAKMTIRFGPVTQSYTSRVVADETAQTITAKAVDGPFSYLDSRWTFAPEGAGTRVRFDIDFKISNLCCGRLPSRRSPPSRRRSWKRSWMRRTGGTGASGIPPSLRSACVVRQAQHEDLRRHGGTFESIIQRSP